MKLNRMLTALNRFLSKSAQHALPFYKLLRNEETFEWTKGWEEAFMKLKNVLDQPLVLSKPMEGETLFV